MKRIGRLPAVGVSRRGILTTAPAGTFIVKHKLNCSISLPPLSSPPHLRPTTGSGAVKRAEELLPLVKDDTPPNDPNCIELEFLSNLVADYSDEHFAPGEPSLVDVLKLRMSEMGLSRKTLAKMVGISPSCLSDYISGKCEPTLSVARELSRKLNTDAHIVPGV